MERQVRCGFRHGTPIDFQKERVTSEMDGVSLCLPAKMMCTACVVRTAVRQAV